MSDYFVLDEKMAKQLLALLDNKDIKKIKEIDMFITFLLYENNDNKKKIAELTKEIDNLKKEKSLS